MRRYRQASKPAPLATSAPAVARTPTGAFDEATASAARPGMVLDTSGTVVLGLVVVGAWVVVTASLVVEVAGTVVVDDWATLVVGGMVVVDVGATVVVVEEVVDDVLEGGGGGEPPLADSTSARSDPVT